MQEEPNIKIQPLGSSEDLLDAVEDQLNLSGDSTAMSSASAASFEQARDLVCLQSHVMSVVQTPFEILIYKLIFFFGCTVRITRDCHHTDGDSMISIVF